MIKLKAIIPIKETTPHWELSWDHVNKLMSIQIFRGRWSAKEYIKDQGHTAREAKVRMIRMPEHEWANEHGNVAVVRFDDKEPVGGWEYLFVNGDRLGLGMHGLPKG